MHSPTLQRDCVAALLVYPRGQVLQLVALAPENLPAGQERRTPPLHQ